MSDGLYMRRAIRTCNRIGIVSTILFGLGTVSLFVGGCILAASVIVPGASLLGAGAAFLVAGIRLAWFADIKLGELEAMREIAELNERTLEILETTFAPPKKKRRRKRVKSIGYSGGDEDELSNDGEFEQTVNDMQDPDASIVSDEEVLSPSHPSEEDVADDYDAFLDECEREEQEQLNHKKKTHG